jgi:hypothetical protein
MLGVKPGERVKAITQATRALLGRSHAESQLVLKQFGFETWAPPAESEREYLFDVLGSERADDDDLGELLAYLEGSDAAPVSEGPWGSQPLKVFISHVHEDAGFAGDTKRLFERHFGMTAFVAHDDIHPSKQWRDVIQVALSTCDAMIALTHPRFHQSQWCDQEVGWALGRGVPVVPVRPDGFDRSSAADGFLEERQDFELKGSLS